MGQFLLVLLLLNGPPGLSQPSEGNAESRAVAFLAREVPRWRNEHPCYSCHNNGDAARALIVAAQRGYAVGSALDDTLEWLRQPSRWNESPSTGGIDDKPLARIQFAGALRLAVDAGHAPTVVLEEAARLVAKDQKPNGSWQLDSSQSLGSPTTYGIVLATAAARTALGAVATREVQPATAKADAWLRAVKIETVIDAAGVILGLGRASDDGARRQKNGALAIIQRGRSPQGGWGPYLTSSPEVFDTALVLLALREMESERVLGAKLRGYDQWRKAGRQYLLARQLPDGSWPETTRPSGQESYAQKISTTGWALLALLATP